MSREGGDGKIIQFPRDRIKRTPDEVAVHKAEEGSKDLDKIAQGILKEFRRTLDEPARAHIENIKKLVSGHSLDHLTREVRRIKQRSESGYVTSSVDIAMIEAYLDKRANTQPEKPRG